MLYGLFLLLLLLRGGVTAPLRERPSLPTCSLFKSAPPPPPLAALSRENRRHVRARRQSGFEGKSRVYAGTGAGGETAACAVPEDGCCPRELGGGGSLAC